MGKYLDEAFDRLKGAISSPSSEKEINARFALAVITLNTFREECGIDLSDPVESENEMCVALIYQIRNAFAHDPSEPAWYITRQRFRKVYNVGDISVNLKDKHGVPFSFEHIGGISTLSVLREHLSESL